MLSIQSIWDKESLGQRKSCSNDLLTSLHTSMIWLDPMYWIAEKTGYDAFSRVVFQYYRDVLLYLEGLADEAQHSDEVEKLLYHAYWEMDYISSKAYESSLEEKEQQGRRVIPFQDKTGHYYGEYMYAHKRLSEIRRTYHTSGRDTRKSFPVSKETVLCPYKDRLTPYERKVLKDAIQFADLIITDGDMAVGLSYEPDERGDYAPVTMGYVREANNPGILDLLRGKKPVHDNAALTRYLHSFDNPYCEIPADLYQTVAELYAKYRVTMKSDGDIIRIDDWKNHTIT